MEEMTRVKYFRHKIDNLLVVSKIITVHYFEFDRHFVSEGEAHDFWELVYVDSGELCCMAGDETVTLRQGEVMFHRPGEFHRHSSGNRAPSVAILSFECRSEGMRFFEGKRMSLPRDCSRYIFEILSEASATFDIPVSDPLARKMELLTDPALGGTQMIKNRLEMLLILLLRRETSRKGAGDLFLRDEAPGSLLADAIVAKMRTHLYDGLSVEELCEGVAYSRSYIFRTFRQATGQTIASYYNKLRIAEAKRLIREKNLSLSEISDMLSFDSPNYFGKTFKRFTGVTPRAYRARYHGGS